VIFVAWRLGNRSSPIAPKSSLSMRSPSGVSTSSASATPQVVTTPSSPLVNDPTQELVTVWEKALKTPIDFSGKVVDLEQRPVPDAVIRYWIAEKLGTPNTTREMRSDEAGSFQIKGVGLGVTVEVSKSGYYTLKESRGTFGYAAGANGTRPIPTVEHPALFRLRKAGSAQQLIHFEQYFLLPKNGETRNVSLVTCELVGNEKTAVAIQIQSLANDQSKNERREFNWSLTLSVPNGGLIERNDEFDFEAPEFGYQPSVTINMPTATQTKWEREINKEFFVRVPSGYARISLTYVAGGHNRLLLRSWYNPSGSRNLESDPSKLE